ncbi:MAG: TonB-dependent receptor [Acidobacteria bacterium]|nr:MAG: TonB-dependent receptor [Acidobacteriota bacterium]
MESWKRQFVGCGVALLLATPMMGQEQSQAEGEQTEEARPGRDTFLEEVTVTATKREESLQDVPIAVTAVTELQMERAGFQDIRDLPVLASSFNMNSTQTESQGSTLRIRGVGTTGNNIGLESAVGVFLDGVYLSRPGVALGDQMDIEAIEVLRGPQGTLFGRNVSAGALNIRTKAPNLGGSNYFANFTGGNFGAFNVQAGATRSGVGQPRLPALGRGAQPRWLRREHHRRREPDPRSRPVARPAALRAQRQLVAAHHRRLLGRRRAVLRRCHPGRDPRRCVGLVRGRRSAQGRRRPGHRRPRVRGAHLERRAVRQSLRADRLLARVEQDLRWLDDPDLYRVVP